MIVRIIEDTEGNIFPVTNLLDGEDREVSELHRAQKFVAKLADDQWLGASVVDALIHTVH